MSTPPPTVKSALQQPMCETIVRDCIEACSAAKDERGRWRPEAECKRRLEEVYGPSAANVAAAWAARRLGAWIAGLHS